MKRNNITIWAVYRIDRKIIPRYRGYNCIDRAVFASTWRWLSNLVCYFSRGETYVCPTEFDLVDEPTEEQNIQTNKQNQ